MNTSLALAAAIVLPLAAALAAIVRPRAGAVAALVLGPAMAALTLWLAAAVLRNGPIALVVGGHLPPLGIRLEADGLSAAFLVVTAVVMGAILLYARPEFPAERSETRAAAIFWPLALLVWTALNTVFLSADLFNLYVALELMTLGAVSLVALRNDAETTAAALRYLFFAFVGALLYLLGVGLLYARYATLDVALLAPLVEGDAVTLAGGALMTAGLAVKAALFPFHGWLPPAHAGAPSPASALLSALVPKAAFFILLRLWFDVMPGLATPDVVGTLAVLGALAVLYGSMMALVQDRLKLVVAYSTVAQVGYLFLVFALAGGAEAQPWSGRAYTGSVLHALSHALAKAALFLAAGLVIQTVGHDRMAGLDGLSRRMPVTVFAIALASVTLMGLPPSGGFVAKYLLLTSAAAAGEPVWAAVLVGGGILSAAYLFRPLSRMLARPAEPVAAERFRPVEALPLMLAGLAILLGLASSEPFRLVGVGRTPAAEEGLP
jgi:formate hydrogenlyase subunit 3/multisubunit Na+/H+ antiporter MnhD subunit